MKPIPKSLHTVMVLVAMAKIIRASRPAYTWEDAVGQALYQLDYGYTIDTYDLKNQAVKKLSKGQ